MCGGVARTEGGGRRLWCNVVALDILGVPQSFGAPQSSSALLARYLPSVETTAGLDFGGLGSERMREIEETLREVVLSELGSKAFGFRGPPSSPRPDAARALGPGSGPGT
eukprot:6407421-Pyramimonas_sp.AAC.1